MPAARRGGVTPWGPRLLSQVILYFLVGGFAGYMQREQNRVRRILSRSSITDELTGLYNRRYFRARLDEEVRRAKRYGPPLSLLICDIDRFKRYNDAFGRANGDFVLNRIAGLIKESMRESDIPFRYGGDEFAIILPETGMESRQVAERIVGTVNSAFSGQKGDPSLRPRIAAGVAARDAEQPLSAALLVSFADNALRKAKAGGAPYTLFRIGDQAGAELIEAAPGRGRVGRCCLAVTGGQGGTEAVERGRRRNQGPLPGRDGFRAIHQQLRVTHIGRLADRAAP